MMVGSGDNKKTVHRHGDHKHPMQDAKKMCLLDNKKNAQLVIIKWRGGTKETSETKVSATHNGSDTEIGRTHIMQ